jgi:hypothetical protein
MDLDTVPCISLNTHRTENKLNVSQLDMHSISYYYFCTVNPFINIPYKLHNSKYGPNRPTRTEMSFSQ